MIKRPQRPETNESRATMEVQRQEESSDPEYLATVKHSEYIEYE